MQRPLPVARLQCFPVTGFPGVHLAFALLVLGVLGLKPAFAQDEGVDTEGPTDVMMRTCPMGGAVGCPMMQVAPARAALGISLNDEDGEGAVPGPTVARVIPGGGAEDAGLEVGDVLTAVNGESLEAGSRAEANRRLVRLMETVNPGEEVRVAYQREGKAGNVTVEARPLPPPPMLGMPPMMGGRMPGPGMHEGGMMRRSLEGSFRGLRLAEMNEGLGRYFGTSKGLLVLRRPGNSAIPLQDGDVIQEIAGRKPNGIRHAQRILGSYAAGEQLSIAVLRDKKARTLSFLVPELPAPEGQMGTQPREPAGSRPPGDPRPRD